jgi:hypothetical protein
MASGEAEPFVLTATLACWYVKTSFRCSSVSGAVFFGAVFFGAVFFGLAFVFFGLIFSFFGLIFSFFGSGLPSR